MSKPKRIERTIPLDRIFLNRKNPRHEPYRTQLQTIKWLCAKEEVLQLARDIAKYGLSPLDRFGVYKDHDTGGEDATFIAAEGNRRLCAMKLLTDPDLAPPGRQAYFEGLAKKWTPITQLPCIIFEDKKDLDIWLKRRHHGQAGGIGQKPWNADQKARHSGVGSRNQVALAFLDYAEREELISAEGRKRKLTTVQRFLSNPVMRETLGLDTHDPRKIARNRTEEDFNLLAQRFVLDMLGENPKINSRYNKANIEVYARELGSIEGQSNERIEPEPLMSGSSKPKSKRRQQPGKVKGPQRLPHQPEIESTLETLNSWKLRSLYRSICAISLQENTPILAVGVWSFFETLTALAGRDPGTDFYSFLSPQKFSEYKLGTKRQTNPLRQAVRRILDYGNATKHHSTAAAFNGDQLANDLDSLEELILKIIEDAISQQKNRLLRVNLAPESNDSL